MQQISPEIPEKVAPVFGIGADLASELAEITNINREFLRLIAGPAVAQADALLGLDVGVVQALRALSPAQLDRIAAAPQLLAEFRPLPGAGDACAVEDAELFARSDTRWERELRDFAQRLLVCLWQTARHNSQMLALNAGLSAASSKFLAAQSFTAIGRYAADGAHYLRARFASHPRFWPDLIRSVRNGTTEQQAASRLALVQLSVSQAGLKKNQNLPPVATRYRR